jgi:hypothetical protein
VEHAVKQAIVNVAAALEGNTGYREKSEKYP